MPRFVALLRMPRAAASYPSPEGVGAKFRIPLPMMDTGPLSSASPRVTARFKTPRPIGLPPANTPLSSSFSALPRLMATLPSLPPSSPVCRYVRADAERTSEANPRDGEVEGAIGRRLSAAAARRARLRAPTDVAKVLAPVAIAKFNNRLAVASVPSPFRSRSRRGCWCSRYPS